MKNVKQILVLGAIALGMGQIFGHDLNNRHTLKDPGFTEVAKEDSKPANNMVRIALLLDTSNSMDGLINQAKAQLWDIVNKFTHVNCRLPYTNTETMIYPPGKVIFNRF